MRAAWPKRIAFWLLRHLVLLTLLGLAVWGYLWRDDLLPEWFASAPGPELRVGDDGPEAVGPSQAGRAFRPVSPVADGSARGEAGPGVAQQLQAARRSYWTEGAASAEPLYRQIIASHPGVPDAYGELGNVLLAQGRATEARALFAQTVVLLDLEGRGGAARQLRRYLDDGNGVNPKGASNQ